MISVMNQTKVTADRKLVQSDFCVLNVVSVFCQGIFLRALLTGDALEQNFCGQIHFRYHQNYILLLLIIINNILKVLRSPALKEKQHFPNLFDCRTLKSWPFLYPRHQSYQGQPLGNPSLSVFMGASSVKDKFAIFFYDDSDLFSVEHKICFPHCRVDFVLN